MTAYEVDFEEVREDHNWPQPNTMREAANALRTLGNEKIAKILEWVADECDDSAVEEMPWLNARPGELWELDTDYSGSELRTDLFVARYHNHSSINYLVFEPVDEAYPVSHLGARATIINDGRFIKPAWAAARLLAGGTK